MSAELVVVEAPDTVSAPSVIEELRFLSELGRSLLLQQNGTVDFGVGVIAEQIQVLRNTASDLDRQYAKNVRGKKLTFQSRAGYLALREKIAARIAGLVQNIRQMQPAEPVRIPLGGARSWDPDAPRGAGTPQAE